MFARAIVRSVSSNFHRALTSSPEPPDAGRARRQHARYVEALRRLGLEVFPIEGEADCPDCCFVEDCAVVADGVALLTRPGALSRQAEVGAVRSALESFVRVEMMQAPATLDGGDCLRLGRTIFVGRSARTNEAGVERLREVFEPPGFRVVPVALQDVLHLKCVCSPLGERTLTLVEGTIPSDVFGDADIVWIPREEGYAANCVAVGSQVIVAEGFPHAVARIEAAGFRTLPVDVSEMRKADGSLTCMSILV